MLDWDDAPLTWRDRVRFSDPPPVLPHIQCGTCQELVRVGARHDCPPVCVKCATRHRSGKCAKPKRAAGAPKAAK